MRKLSLFVLVIAVAVPASALGVWGGTIDTTHSGVGALYVGAPVSDKLICSGSYAGPSKNGQNDVFLTAGHCIPPAELGIPASALFVSFDGDGRDGVSNPIQVSSYHQMPGFGQNFGDPRDLGILLLPADSVPVGTPWVQLPPAGYLDSLKAAGTLTFTIADIVGYGVIPIWDEKGPTQFAFDGVRRSGNSIITGLRDSMVIYSQNRGIGTGSGMCSGDSGSPQLAQGTLLVLSVTKGGNGQCNSNNQNYRVDTPQARAFLGQFLNLP